MNDTSNTPVADAVAREAAAIESLTNYVNLPDCHTADELMAVYQAAKDVIDGTSGRAKEMLSLAEQNATLAALLREGLRRWSFSEDQQHTHTWHDRADWASKVNDALSANPSRGAS